MALTDILRDRAARRGGTAQVDCGELGCLTVEALSPADCARLSDSRSLLSYPRHHYFRRILCNTLGGMMERGEMTRNEASVGEVIRDVCYRNAVQYFHMD